MLNYLKSLILAVVFPFLKTHRSSIDQRSVSLLWTKAIEIFPEPVDRLQLVPETYIGGEASQVEVAQGSLARVHCDEDQVFVHKDVRIDVGRREEKEDGQGEVVLWNPEVEDEAILLAADSLTRHLVKNKDNDMDEDLDNDKDKSQQSPEDTQRQPSLRGILSTLGGAQDVGT